MNSRQLNHQLWPNKEANSLDLLQPILTLLLKFEIEVKEEQGDNQTDLHEGEVLADAVAWSLRELFPFISFFLHLQKQ